MKEQYFKPLIKTEELLKADVLLSINPKEATTVVNPEATIKSDGDSSHIGV